MAEAKDTAPRLTIRDYKAKGRAVESIPWPGQPGRKVGLLCPLTVAELQAAHFAAVEHFQQAVQPMDGFHAARDFLLEKDVQECYLALLRPGSSRPLDRLFKSADEVRSELDADELNYFQRAYAHLAEMRLRAMKVWQEARETTARPWEEVE